MLAADGIAARRGERLVFGALSFRVPPGGALLLHGANGGGKSTLLRVLAGLGRLAAGRLLWEGADALAERSLHAARLRYLGHLDALKPALTAGETLRLEAALRGSGASEAHVAAALDAFALAPLAEMPVRVLSAGQRRRLALARVALAPAALWLLDEPSLGLDDASVARLGAAIARHRAAGGMVVAATHLPLPLGTDAAALRLGA